MADVVATNVSASSLFDAFKELYGDMIAQQANVLPFLYNKFEKTKWPLEGGKYWTEPIHDEGGQSVGSYNQDEKTSDAQAETVKAMQVYSRMHFAKIQITGFAMKSARSNLASFVRSKDFEVKSKTEWLVSQLNAQCYQNGRGILGNVLAATQQGVSGGVPGTVNQAVIFTVDLTAAQTFPTSPFWFRKGLKIDVFNSALSARRNTTTGSGDTVTKGQGWQIASAVYNSGAGTLTITTTVAGTQQANVANGDVITYEDAQLTGTFAPALGATAGKQLTGLATLVDDNTEGPTTVQNVSRTTFPIFNATRLNNSGTRRPLSLDLLQAGSDQAQILSGMEPDMLISAFGQRRNYLNLLIENVRFVANEMKGGYRTLQFNGLNYLVDKDCQLARVYFLNTKTFNKFEVAPLGILDDAGTQMERIPGFDVYEILLGAYLNMGITRPNANVKIVDLIEP